MLVAAVVAICMSGQCSQMSGNIHSVWCGKSATLERPASMGGNATIRVQCSRVRPGHGIAPAN